MKGRGQNIPLVTDTLPGLYKKAFVKIQSCKHLCRSSKSLEQATHIGEGLVQPNFKEVKDFFPSTSCIKKFHTKRERGRPSKSSRPQYCSGDKYRIRVVQESFCQSSILQAFVQITNSNGADNFHGRRPGIAKL